MFLQPYLIEYVFYSFENNQIRPQPSFSSHLQQEENNRFTISTIQVKYIPKIHTQIRKPNNKIKIKHREILISDLDLSMRTINHLKPK